MTMLIKNPVKIAAEEVRWLELRGWVYQLLMDFLSRPPRMSLIAQWRGVVELKNSIPASQGGTILKDYLASIAEEDFRKVCYAEAEEYERLFMGHNAKIAACEAVYRARAEGANAFDCISEIGTIYAQSGVAFNKLNGERDDHIALELEFMAVLAEGMLNKNNLRQSCLELVDTQIAFLESHLLKWTPQFSEDLAGATTSPLYTGLSVLMSEFLAEDLEQLQTWRENELLFGEVNISSDDWLN